MLHNVIIYNNYSIHCYLYQPLQEEIVALSPLEKSKWEWPSTENDQPVNKEDDKPVNKGSILLTRGKTRREV